jgi:hypothetical protein
MLNVYGVDSITIVRDGGYDRRNEPSATTSESIKGYVEWKTHLVRDINGEEVVSLGYVTLPYDSTIDHKDKLTISSVTYSILSIDRMKDFSNRGLIVHFK